MRFYDFSPHSTPREVDDQLLILAADRFIALYTWKWLDLHAKIPRNRSIAYLYSKLARHWKDCQYWLQDWPAGTVGKVDKKKCLKLSERPHACEIEYCHGNLHCRRFCLDAGIISSKTFMSFFANFIKTGKSKLVWKSSRMAYWGNDENPPVMDINTESKMV